MRVLIAALCWSLLAALGPARASDFDFYVLALSWSPGWCDETGSDSAQCDPDANSGFVVHGLWPQYERGAPRSCDVGERLPRRLINSMLDIMPEPGLVISQWRSHGTCTGLSGEGYFEETRAAYDNVSIPYDLEMPVTDSEMSVAEIERSFVSANPGLEREGIAIDCDSGWLREVRICLDRNLSFRTCEEVDRRGCRSGRLRLTGD